MVLTKELVSFFLLVSLRPTACDQTERMQEAVHGPDAGKECVPMPFCVLVEAHYVLTILEVLAVPKNMKLLAIPLFELYDNAARYDVSLLLECGNQLTDLYFLALYLDMLDV